MSTATLESHDTMDSAIQLTDNLPTAKSAKETSFGQPLQIDFTWKKFRAVISAKADSQAKPLYDVKCHAFSPHYTYDCPQQNNARIGTGTLHAIHTKATCTVHSKEILLQPLKRLHTKYNYLSNAFLRGDGSQAVLIWEGALHWKTWDFVCLDEQLLPVARIKVNVWGVTDLGSIEFMEPESITEAMRDEIVITGTMVYQQMLLRANNFLNLVGTGFTKTGPVRNEKEEERD